MKRNKEKVSKPVETIDTLIGSGSILQGDLEFTGGLRVDGHVKGHVSAQDSNNGTLVLSESGVIEGDVNVPHVVVNGTIKGNISSNGHVELQAKANVTGDIHYKAVENGVRRDAQWQPSFRRQRPSLRCDRWRC